MPYVLRIWKNLYLNFVEIMTLGIFVAISGYFQSFLLALDGTAESSVRLNPIRGCRRTCFESFNVSDTLDLCEIDLYISSAFSRLYFQKMLTQDSFSSHNSSFFTL